jgi:hypothetical protein
MVGHRESKAREPQKKAAVASSGFQKNDRDARVLG